MKHLIPVTFALVGAYLMGLPILSQTAAMGIIGTVMQGTQESIRYSPATPYIYPIVTWIVGMVCVCVAIYFALRSYRD